MKLLATALCLATLVTPATAGSDPEAAEAGGIGMVFSNGVYEGKRWEVALIKKDYWEGEEMAGYSITVLEFYDGNRNNGKKVDFIVTCYGDKQVSMAKPDGSLEHLLPNLWPKLTDKTKDL